MTFYKYLVIKYMDVISLVAITEKNPEKLHWFGGPSYMMIGNDVEIYDEFLVEEFSWAEDPEDEIELAYYRKWCPPKKTDLSATGWIAPNGDFYGCAYGEHDRVAKQIVAVVYDDLYLSTRKLEEKGWLRIQDGFVYGHDVDPTQAQIDTAWDISRLETLSEKEKKNLKRTIFWTLDQEETS